MTSLFPSITCQINFLKIVNKFKKRINQVYVHKLEKKYEVLLEEKIKKESSKPNGSSIFLKYEEIESIVTEYFEKK